MTEEEKIEASRSSNYSPDVARDALKDRRIFGTGISKERSITTGVI